MLFHDAHFGVVADDRQSAVLGEVQIHLLVRVRLAQTHGTF
jgi:hypothetical protein